MMTSAQLLLQDIERFLKQHDMTATRFGLLACNDGHLVHQLREGRQVTLRRSDHIRAFMMIYRGPKVRRGRPRRSKSLMRMSA